MNPVYVIGDIHGHLEKLKTIHDLVANDQARYGAGNIVHVGDLVDRGPDAKGVLQYLIDGQAAGENWVVLKGNHDRMMQWFLQDEPKRDPRLRAGLNWLHPRIGGLMTLASFGADPAAPAGAHWLHPMGGGGKTLESYGVAGETLPSAVHELARKAVPPAHVNFLAGLPLSYQTDEALIVHAGIRPGVPFSEQSEDDLLWIRDDFHTSLANHDKLIIHGHTPVDEVTHYGNRVNVDTGAGHDRHLSVVVVEGREVSLLGNEGRSKLEPV